MLGLVSIFYALAVALVPLIAKRIISGDVGSSALALVRAGGFAVGAALAGVSGLATGPEHLERPVEVRPGPAAEWAQVLPAHRRV